MKESMKIVKSPLNYTGGKYKLLSQILPILPERIDTFVDLFAGGCNVGTNVIANKIIFNDIQQDVINLMSFFKKSDPDKLIEDLVKLSDMYGLSDTSKNGYEYYGCESSKGVSKYNKEGYLKLREDFNKDRSNSSFFFLTVIFAFNNQIRFNKNGQFNMPVNKRDFNKNIRKNTKEFINRLNNLNCFFSKVSFDVFDFDGLDKNDLVYADPPYLLSTASYNENGGWDDSMEKKLLEKLDSLNDVGIKFALSNVLEHKGKSNTILKKWSDKYNIHYLNFNYNNSNYQSKSCRNDTVEVLITNF